MTFNDKKIITTYLLVTFGITYIAWGMLALMTQTHFITLNTPIGRTPHILGSLGPAIASYICLKFQKQVSFKDFLFTKKKKSLPYLLVHLLVIFTLFAISSLELTSLPLYVMPLFFLSLILFGGGHEELGWRGTLQPILDKRFTYWQSNLIVGAIWGIWHLPLWLIVGESHQGFPFVLFFIYTLFLSFALGLLYRQTQSVWYCTLFHAFANLMNAYFILKINFVFIVIAILYLAYILFSSQKLQS